MLLRVLIVVAARAAALDNGLARTPPMGWMTWERFRCEIDCDADPDNCISEQLIKSHADILAATLFNHASAYKAAYRTSRPRCRRSRATGRPSRAARRR